MQNRLLYRAASASVAAFRSIPRSTRQGSVSWRWGIDEAKKEFLMLRAEHLDLRGEVCPMTFVRVRLWLESAQIGARLAVTVDHQPATRSIPRSLAILGQEFGGCEPLEEGGWRLTLRKIVADPSAAPDAADGAEVFYG
jgi:TusA-related sulfurtransferase